MSFCPEYDSVDKGSIFNDNQHMLITENSVMHTAVYTTGSPKKCLSVMSNYANVYDHNN